MFSEFLIVCAIILSYFGIGFVFNKRRMSPFLGLEFFLIGLLFSLLNVNKNLFLPIVPPFLAMFGLLIGIQIKINDLKALGKGFYFRVFFYSLFVFGLLYVVFSYFSFYEIAAILASVFTLGSYKVIATFVPDRKKDNREKLFFSAFLPFSVVLIYFFSHFIFLSPSVTKWFFILLIIFSVLSRLIFSILESEPLIILSIIGLVLFFSELAYIKGVSPFLVMFFVGGYLANYCKKGDSIYRVLIADEKQLYTTFLIFLGFVSGLKVNFSIIEIALIISISVIVIKYLFFIFDKESFVFYLSPGAFGVVLLSDYWVITGHKYGDPMFSSSIIVIIFLQVLSMLYLKRVYGGKR